MAKQTKNVSSGGESFMVKLSTFIVDKRNLVFPDYHHSCHFLHVFPQLGARLKMI